MQTSENIGHPLNLNIRMLKVKESLNVFVMMFARGDMKIIK